MKSNHRLIRSLERGHRDKESLDRFAVQTKQEGKRLSSVLLALNLPSYLDQLYDEEQEIKPHPLVLTTTDRLMELLAPLMQALSDGMEVSAETTDAILAVRDSNIRHMHLLSAFADRFTVFEYVLNRLEHRFSGKTLPDGYDDADKTQEILNLLSAITDQAARQSTVIQLIEQLPMRMTKKRFFQVIADGLDVYKGSERQTVEDLLFMVRTAALMEEPDGMSEDYAALYRIAGELTQADYTTLDEAGYEKLYQTVSIGMKELNRQMDLVMLLQDLINETAVLALTSDVEASDESVEISIPFITCSIEAAKQKRPLTEDAYAGFEQLEGIQEAASSRFLELSAAADEFSQAYQDDIRKLDMEQTFVVLEQLSRLLSSSRFASVSAAETLTEPADEAYLNAVKASLQKDLSEQLKKLPKLMSRAVMAKVLTMFPLFIREYQELESYIAGSLSSCTDEAEKVACLEILDDLLHPGA